MLQCYSSLYGTPAPGCDLASCSWAHLNAPDEKELLQVSELLGIPMDFLTDPLDVDERARIEIDDECLLMVLHTPVRVEDGESVPFGTVPLGIILKNGCLVTVASRHIDIMDLFLSGKVKHFSADQPVRFVIQIFHQTAILFLKYLKEINKITNAYEKELHRAMKNEELIGLVNMEKSLVFFSTAIKANEIIMSRIQRSEIIKMSSQDIDLLDDAITENLQAIYMTKIYSNILSGMMNAFASIISNNLNGVMKFLTTVTIVLMIPNLVFSFFGQNVKIPIGESEHGMLITIGLAAVAALAGVWIGMRRRLF